MVYLKVIIIGIEMAQGDEMIRKHSKAVTLGTTVYQSTARDACWLSVTAYVTSHRTLSCTLP